MESIKDSPFGIYIHWPFCEKKCPYCDFNSHVIPIIDQNRYAQAIIKELSYFKEIIGDRKVSSIFFGGGTPSLMDGETAEYILSYIFKYFEIENNVEISLEANPSSVEAERFAYYSQIGFNRISLGIQSLNNQSLLDLGRIHDRDQSLLAIDTARRYFKRYSIDMIFARHNQKITEWEAELKEVLSLANGHISLYQLTIEKGTRFYSLYKKGQLNLAIDDDAANFYQTTQNIAEQFGYQQYEISNYAKPGQECKHNLLYWQSHDYIGIGPGAHSRFFKKDAVMRSAVNLERNPSKWLTLVEKQSHAIKEQEELSFSAMADEQLLMGLRLLSFFNISSYERLRQRVIDRNKIRQLKDQGLIEFIIENNDLMIRVTKYGCLFLNYIILQLAS